MEFTVSNSLQKTIKHWYLPFISGLLFIIAGVITFTYLGESYVALSGLFSITFIVMGCSDMIFSILNRKVIKGWGWSFLMGSTNTLLGLFLIENPLISIITLPMYVGFTFLIRAVGTISFSQDLKRFGLLVHDPLMFIGITGVVLSLILIWNPIFAGFTIVGLTGFTCILIGVYHVSLAIKLKKVKRFIKEASDLEIV
ncbi:HdeD family acid-resistance protein [Flammeovirga kamogawensis]|uniref:DUF308 domain-containing protein n=1 Tax=Flammeovirga kamogawensis TaxID=373891 RepID=A0ABX8GST9_9BACT|nr:DUF308 domain-containing protein [Flammeovirga kamogawensis]MBB6461476.1 uncharacterized membrane protein HdeD (DUF308 family) [Flammeovirga kamogawensis]QWG06368.1 DUF308 domain-containing protein [Flammeovirga kamogawensis]TRX68197.1 HdeD family acid-resistance protein [Flammeovirga kamogawensis]